MNEFPGRRSFMLCLQLGIGSRWIEMQREGGKVFLKGIGYSISGPGSILRYSGLHGRGDLEQTGKERVYWTLTIIGTDMTNAWSLLKILIGHCRLRIWRHFSKHQCCGNFNLLYDMNCISFLKVERWFTKEDDYSGDISWNWTSYESWSLLLYCGISRAEKVIMKNTSAQGKENPFWIFEIGYFG